MNSKEGRNIRPIGTYIMDLNGNVVKSRDVENFGAMCNLVIKKPGARELTTSSPISPVSTLRLSPESCRYSIDSDVTLRSLDYKDDIKAADNLIHDIDEMSKEDKCESKTRASLSEIKNNITESTPRKNADNRQKPFQVTITKQQGQLQKQINIDETKAKEMDIQDEMSNCSPKSVEDAHHLCVPQMTALPDGLMAVRLPPIHHGLQLEDYFQKMVKEENIVHAVDLAKPSLMSNGRHYQKNDDNLPRFVQNSKDVVAMVTTLPGEVLGESDNIGTNVTRRITIIDTEVESERGKGLRKYFCGLCGVSSPNKSGEMGNKTPNCFQRLWKRIKKMF